MADLPIGNEIALNGTTATVLLAAPAADEQRVVPVNGVSFYNADTVAHTFTVQKNKNSTLYVIYKSPSTVAAGATEVVPVATILDDTDENLEVFMDATATTTEPKAQVAAMETS